MLPGTAITPSRRAWGVLPASGQALVPKRGGGGDVPAGDTEMIPFGAFLLSSHLLVAVADVVPNIDLKKTCSDTASVYGGGPTQSDIDNCVTDEQDAHGLLVKQWKQYAAPDKNRCVRASSDYLPSYVELLTCLEIAKDVKSIPEEQGLGTVGKTR